MTIIPSKFLPRQRDINLSTKRAFIPTRISTCLSSVTLIAGEDILAEEFYQIYREKDRKMYGFEAVSSSEDGGVKGDIEEGTLYPGLGYGENQLRWGFIRKVYGILAAQIVLTTVVSAITVLYTPVNELLRSNSGLLIFLIFLPFIRKPPSKP